MKTRLEEAFEEALCMIYDPTTADKRGEFRQQNTEDALYKLLSVFITSTSRRLKSLEPVILHCDFVNDSDLNLSIRALYARDIMKGKWPALEAQLLKEADPYGLVEYAREVLHRRWPEAEKIINQNKYAREAYEMEVPA
jgi:hypothetical protein